MPHDLEYENIYAIALLSKDMLEFYMNMILIKVNKKVWELY